MKEEMDENGRKEMEIGNHKALWVKKNGDKKKKTRIEDNKNK